MCVADIVSGWACSVLTEFSGATGGRVTTEG